MRMDDSGKSFLELKVKMYRFLCVCADCLEFIVYLMQGTGLWVVRKALLWLEKVESGFSDFL